MGKYRKKPVVIEAIQWGGKKDWWEAGNFIPFNKYEIEGECLLIKTLEGTMRANKGDYIIRGVNGEYYPCKPDIFEKTYEMVKEE